MDGSSKERVLTLPFKGRVGFHMVHQNYLYYTYFGGTYRIPFSGGEAQQVLLDSESFNLFGNKMFLSRIIHSKYLSNAPTRLNLIYPVSTIFVADLDGKNMRSLFSTDEYPAMLNIGSPDYVYAEAYAARGIFFSVNPSITTDVSMPTGKFDAEKNEVIDPMTVSVKGAKFVDKGHAADGWYYPHCMNNYLSINAQGQAEFNDSEPYQKF